MAEIEGICVPVRGYEEDYLDFFGKTVDEGRNLGVCGMLQMAGATSTDWATATAFDYAMVREPDQVGQSSWTQGRKEYRQESGRRFPPLYRVKIKVEVEPVPDDEAEKLWNERAKQYARPEVVEP